MLVRRTLLLATVALLTPHTALAQSGAGQEPTQIVDWIYKETAKSAKNPSYNFSLLEKKYRGRFSKAFLTAWDRAEKIAAKKEEPLIEADPVTETQDPQVHSFTVRVDSQNETAAKLTALYRYSAKDAPKPITYAFVKEAGAWKIDDIGAPNGLRKLFAGYK